MSFPTGNLGSNTLKLLKMKALPLIGALLLSATPALADNVGGSGTQPYACSVVGNSSLNLVSTGNNQLTATGSGSVSQNGATDYALSSVTATGPDANLQASTTAIGTTLNLASTESAGDAQSIAGELTDTVNYTVTLSSSDGTLTAGAYTSAAELTCIATP